MELVSGDAAAQQEIVRTGLRPPPMRTPLGTPT
jgi:hypothetical protein